MEELTLPVIQPQRREFRPIIYWYTTFRCNLACKHCWVNSSPDVDISGDMKTEQMLQAVEKVAEFNPNAVVFTGGDPLIRKDFPQVLEAMHCKGVGYTLETNGMMITPAIADLIRSGVDQGLRIMVAISLDGGTAESHDWLRGKNSFQSAVRGIKEVVARGIHHTVQCVINQRNIHTVPELGRLMAEIGVKHLSLTFSNPVGRAIEYFDQLALPLDLHMRAFDYMAEVIETYPMAVTVKVPPAVIPPHMLKRLMPAVTGNPTEKVKNLTSCAFPLLGILPDGSVTICAMTREMEDSNFGHILTMSLRDIWTRRGLDELRATYEQADQLEGICGDCVFKQTCKGSCRAHAATETGSYNGPYPLCAEMEQAGRFPQVYRLSYRESLVSRFRERQQAGD